MTYARIKPVVLAILDGWGHRPEPEDNAIATALTPNWNRFMRDYPHGLINASELHVGLPEGQMGNSEVGHMNIGAGRVVMQDLPRIDHAIATGELAQHTELQSLAADLKAKQRTCHIMGLVSPGGVHSHQAHIAALAKIMSEAGVPVCIHAFLDGRDTPPKSAQNYLETLESAITGLPHCTIATVSGRYYAMDRDKRWDRVQLAYDAITAANAPKSDNAKNAVEASYGQGVNDEFVKPVVIGDYKGMENGDALIMANFRADRARQLLTALLDPAFDGFTRARTPSFTRAIGMTEYSTALNAFLTTLFPPESLTNLLGEVIANAGLKQLRIAETEKYAHVTFFFNGGREQEFDGEERILVPSPKVATYDLKPEMSAYEVTEKLVAAIESDAFDFIVVNYANTDMVGHTGDIEAARKAVEAVDDCLGKVWAAVEKKHGVMLVTADHGNAEMMHDHSTGQAHTAHTLNLVPALLLNASGQAFENSVPEGKLADIAPTMLALLGLKQPMEMTGQTLFTPRTLAA